jgi:hypothetical protein
VGRPIRLPPPDSTEPVSNEQAFLQTRWSPVRPTGFFVVIGEVLTPTGMVRPVRSDLFCLFLMQANRWKSQLLSSRVKIRTLKKCFSQLFRGAGAVFQPFAVA